MLYRIILSLRHLAYDKGWKKVQKADVPTICVGNITVGGTGKTPHVELLLRLLEFRAVAVLSRGYKRKSRGFRVVQETDTARSVGDEPLQMARKFPSATVAVDKDRLHGCRELAAGHPQVIVLDDAFQYRKLDASLKIVLVDYSRPVFEDRLLPWGRLRDLPSRIRKAHAVVVTKCPSELSDEEKERIMKAEPQFVEENAWVQEAYVAKIVEKGSKSDVRLLWYNTTMNNNENETITIADASISKADKEAHDVKVGDFVKLYIAPEKTVGSVKIVFD